MTALEPPTFKKVKELGDALLHMQTHMAAIALARGKLKGNPYYLTKYQMIKIAFMALAQHAPEMLKIDGLNYPEGSMSLSPIRKQVLRVIACGGRPRIIFNGEHLSGETDAMLYLVQKGLLDEHMELTHKGKLMMEQIQKDDYFKKPDRKPARAETVTEPPAPAAPVDDTCMDCIGIGNDLHERDFKGAWIDCRTCNGTGKVKP